MQTLCVRICKSIPTVVIVQKPISAGGNLLPLKREQHRKFGAAAVEQAAFDQRYRRDASASHVDRSGNTDLHLAAENRWLKLAQWLIDNGADMQ